MKPIKAYLLKHNYCEPITIDSLEGYYRAIDCRLVQAVDVKLTSNTWVSCWVDEEGLFSSGIKPFWRLWNYPDPLVGNMVVTGVPDSNGCTTDAPKDFEVHVLVREQLQVIMGGG
ncbi:MAG: hypothetical protein OXE99_06555 [Cellvibrionales bacterium]|nr:hypothetical protein [Cellvibrionales bacterium]